MRVSRVWIRLACILACLAVLLPCVSAGAETTKVAAYLLRLRAAPSTEATVLDAYPRGTVVTILKKGSPWTKVQVRGKTGYMQSNLLAYARYRTTPAETGTKPSGSTKKPSAAQASSGSTMYVMKGIKLYLREEASTSGDIIGAFRGGTPVTVLRHGKYWCYVEVKGLTGYMGTDYLVSEKE